ncbi:hypothetical protein CRU87_08430 [Aliarcobacter trophiarum LMG 25534]|uniref:Uncharacterized protein n=1 Tax=Aliarcobacter trophiarum LMG 25534 TaxID=1032241 RepID=A0AAD0QJV6_9BACT|nr:hypothetical protein [Aliarcobacter trophiarum]AXK49046.1 hypothetical protein ATR_1185 [Aliarcobacter trophiarum LMG 25534]RXJ89912.1 hypothetical protein CRU87_08430 [Aliarcobacter trophiarum LMG 25534]
MTKFDYSEIKSSIKDNQIRSNKIKIRKYILIILLLFVSLNIYTYFSEYKRYVVNTPDRLQEAREEFTKAYMFHFVLNSMGENCPSGSLVYEKILEIKKETNNVNYIK